MGTSGTLGYMRGLQVGGVLSSRFYMEYFSKAPVSISLCDEVSMTSLYTCCSRLRVLSYLQEADLEPLVPSGPVAHTARAPEGW